jgi:RNA polymerase sigma-70 factor (ECF subfamily)
MKSATDSSAYSNDIALEIVILAVLMYTPTGWHADSQWKPSFARTAVSNTENTTEWDQARLVASLKEGSETAYRLLIRRYQDRVFRIAYGITLDREESLDICQEVFLQVFRKIGTFKENSRLSTWLHRITVNQALNWKRKWKRRFRWHHRPLENESGIDYPELGSEDDSPEIRYREKELEARFRQKLADLPEEARAVFVLKEVEGLSYEEIAERLNIKRGTVSSRLFYARRRLREALETEEPGVK